MLHAVAFTGLTLALCARLRKRVEWVLPAVMLATLLMLTALAMADALVWADALAIAVCVGVAVFVAAGFLTGRQTPAQWVRSLAANAFTPGLLVLLALMAFYAFAAEPMTVWWRDDLAHWGLEVKSLWYAGGLVDGSHRLNTRFGDYPPGVQVLQWLVMHARGEWSEQALYLTLFYTYAVFLLPLFSGVSWRRAYLLPLAFVAFVAFPTWGNVLSYVFLGIDTTLSLCFGYALILIASHTRGDRFSLVSIGLALCGLFLIKHIGLLLAGFAMAYFALRRADRPLRGFLLTLAPLVTAGVWFIYCQARGLSGYNSAGVVQQVSAMLNGTYQAPEGAAGVLPAMLNALTTKYSGEIIQSAAAPVAIPLGVWLVLMPLVPLVMVRARALARNEGVRTAFAMLGMELVFLVVIYASFFTTFYAETSVYTLAYQDNMVLLVERYLAPIVLGHAMLLGWLVSDAVRRQARLLAKPQTVAAITLAAALFAVSTNWAVMAENLNPDRYFQGVHATGSEAAVRDQETWGNALEDVAGARVLVDLDSTSDYVKELVYSFAPARFFLSTEENTASAETLYAYLNEQGVTHLVCLTDGSALMEAALPMADEYGLYTYTLYEVLRDGEQVTLAEF